MSDKKPGNKNLSAQLDLWGNPDEFHWKEFKVAREYARSLKLKNHEEWDEIVSNRKLQGTNIPSNPDETYINHGWKSWDDWLGTGERRTTGEKPANSLYDPVTGDDLWSSAAESKWMNFFEARNIARGYGFEYREEWELFVNGKFPNREELPENIPGDPDRVYRLVGWRDWKDWLLAPDRRIEYTDFHKAREFVRSNRIPGKEAWNDFLKDDINLTADYKMVLPARPHLEYMDSGWVSWEDWLGLEINYRDFNPTRRFVRSLKLKNISEWKAFCHNRLPDKPPKSENIYSYPEIAYRNEGWKDWEDWLGSAKGDIPSGTGSRPDPSELHEITLECRCKGRLENCPVCDGKGYYIRKI